MSENHNRACSPDWLYEQLQEKESIINGISDSLMLLDAENYEILDVNQAFLNLYKVTRDQVIGNTCHDITHRLPQPCSQLSDHDPCPLEKSVLTGGPSQAEHVHKDRDGNDLYISIRGKLSGDKVEISIDDDGCGIPKEHMDKVLDCFFTTKSYGTGLGLCISKKFIEEYDGSSLSVKSEEGKGTTVNVTLTLHSGEVLNPL
jgi:nitrogen-specific signal transduction histidine kinase